MKRIFDADGDAVVVKVRCGGIGGGCGRLRAEMLFVDGLRYEIRYTRHRCHNFDAYFHERSEVIDAYLAAVAQYEHAIRTGQPFKAATIVLRPLPRHHRVDRELQAERDWEAFASSESPIG
jgi:hypothetical protein